MMRQVLLTNDLVTTPNGRGVVQGRMFENGYIQYAVRHIVADMTSMTAGRTITPRAAALDPNYPIGVWIYDAEEVELA